MKYKKISIIIVSLIILIILLVTAFKFYNNYTVKSDLSKLLEGSGARIEKMSCRGGFFSRIARCDFSFDQENFSKIYSHFNLKSSSELSQERFGTDLGGLSEEDFLGHVNEYKTFRGNSLFQADSSNFCDYKSRITQGYDWFDVNWSSSRKGNGITTYSGITFLVNPKSREGCLVLRVAYG